MADCNAASRGFVSIHGRRQRHVASQNLAADNFTVTQIGGCEFGFLLGAFDGVREESS
jgi:hypothetical protein